MNEVVFDIDRLCEVALDQYGFVTTAQAEEAGVSAPSLAMLVKRGRLERVVRSVYRVPQVPPSSFDRFMLALLWTGCDEAALSHETALDAYDVCDVNPTSIHVVVDGGRRIRRKGGEGYAIHYETVDAKQVGWWEGMRCVKLATAIEQCAATGTPRYLLEQAVENGRKRGLLGKREAERFEATVGGADEQEQRGEPS